MPPSKSTTFPIVSLTLALLMLGVKLDNHQAIAEIPRPNLQLAPVFGCQLQPSANPPNPSPLAKLTSIPISLERFRQILQTTTNPPIVALFQN